MTNDAILKYVETKGTNGKPCLLYTSDAADERSSVDLGGRRIIKKKKNVKVWVGDYDIRKSTNSTQVHNWVVAHIDQVHCAT